MIILSIVQLVGFFFIFSVDRVQNSSLILKYVYIFRVGIEDVAQLV